MENNTYFEAVGTSNVVKEKMLENIVINKANSDFLFSVIQNNQNLLSDDEYFEKQFAVKGADVKALSFLTTQANYHININFFHLLLFAYFSILQFQTVLLHFCRVYLV